MNLKSLRESYTKLLGTFKEAGITLNESQQGNLDSFMGALENKLNETREETIKQTTKEVTERLDKEYGELFGKVVKHMDEHIELQSKVQAKKGEIDSFKTISEAVDSYLESYVEEVLPKKTIVDYSRMQKLEQIHESLKSMLGVKEADMISGKDELEKTFEAEKTELVKTTDDLKKKLDESIKAQKKLARELDVEKAKIMLESKTKDLPEREAKMIKESLKGASTSEIKMKFKTVLESVRNEINDECDKTQTEMSLEEAITEIVGGEKTSSVVNNNNDDETEVPNNDETSASAEEINEGTEDDEIDAEPTDTLNESIDELAMMNWIRLSKGQIL